MIKKPVNENYCATVVEIKNLIPIENCDNVVHTNIFGNLVIVSKDTEVGSKGLFFPIETQLSETFLSMNNLYRHSEKNNDPEKKGYFEDNGRIRCVKFRGNKSQGFFVPISCLDPLFMCKDINGKVREEYTKLGAEFDEINGLEICKKYIIKTRTPGMRNSSKSKKPKVSKIIENQFRFHTDTSQLGKNVTRFKAKSMIQITYKLHGTSLISSNILCKKKLNPIEWVLKKLGVNIRDQQYENIYSSRKVIKNDDINKKQHFYSTDIWGIANNILKEYLLPGMTIYAEIVGYLPDGGAIQKDYDYGCDDKEFEIYIYRITYTNPNGNVFEFSGNQVKEWCNNNGLKAVPELYYGTLENFMKDHSLTSIDEHLHQNFLDLLTKKYHGVDCYMCSNKVPAEGVVIRNENNLDIEAYKYKAEEFYLRETKLLDKGEEDIEEQSNEV